MSKPTLPKGTRDFSPEMMAKRNYLFDQIKEVYKKYGFLPIETPCMESLDVLMGKYGDEGDQLIFKLLNSGDYLSKVQPEIIEKGSKQLLPYIAEKGLRYDLTVPFARYVVNHQNDITFPFKRYQIQPVWRADRPQKGRYREFYQCDADVIGTTSLICEAEIIGMINDVFDRLKFQDFSIILNNRKLLTALSIYLGKEGAESQLCVAIDKLDKIGESKVADELVDKGFQKEATDQLIKLLNVKGSNEEMLSFYESELGKYDIGKQGIEELRELLAYVEQLRIPSDKVILDISLARGLSYYTGAIFEVKPTKVKMGTIAAGGRYDNLTEVFGMKNNSGVGVSFGIDRIYDVLEEMELFPAQNQDTTQLLLAHFDSATMMHALDLLSTIRKAGIKSEAYPDVAKTKKQLSYANKKGIPFVVIIGSREMEAGVYTLKNMDSGEQSDYTIEEIVEKLNNG